MKKNLAWHFVGDKLRDGRPVPADGVWLEHTGELKMCVSGLHWSREPFDALQYAPGETLCLVEIGGEIVEPKTGELNDKGISTRRKIIARMDATELLRYFARMQALSVIHLNEDLCNSEAVCDYLMTGDESLRAAARAAAEASAWAAARGAAGAVAWDAAWDAARDAAEASARAAARAAATEAARDTAWDAARAAAWDAATEAAWDAAREAARAAAWDAAWDAARAAAREAAWDAARDAAKEAAEAAAREHFNSLVYECFEEWL